VSREECIMANMYDYYGAGFRVLVPASTRATDLPNARMRIPAARLLQIFPNLPFGCSSRRVQFWTELYHAAVAVYSSRLLLRSIYT
jgi:hypothetical protein